MTNQFSEHANLLHNYRTLQDSIRIFKSLTSPKCYRVPLSCTFYLSTRVGTQFGREFSSVFLTGLNLDVAVLEGYFHNFSLISLRFISSKFQRTPYFQRSMYVKSHTPTETTLKEDIFSLLNATAYNN